MCARFPCPFMRYKHMEREPGCRDLVEMHNVDTAQTSNTPHGIIKYLNCLKGYPTSTTLFLRDEHADSNTHEIVRLLNLQIQQVSYCPPPPPLNVFFSQLGARRAHIRVGKWCICVLMIRRRGPFASDGNVGSGFLSGAIWVTGPRLPACYQLAPSLTAPLHVEKDANPSVGPAL